MEVGDLFNLVLVSDPKISPDGSRCVFTYTKLDGDKDTYVSNIWVYDVRSKNFWQLTNGGSDKFPEWSPSGDRISFVARRTFKEEEPGAELWVRSLDFPEERMVVKEAGGVWGVDWSPSGDKLIYISSVGEVDRDVKVIERIPFWFNGRGFRYNMFDHLFLVELASGNKFQLTEGEVNVIFAGWSPRGDKVAYVVQEDFLRPYITDIYLVDVTTGEREKLTDGSLNIMDFAWDPSGSRIVFRARDLSRGYSTHARLWVINIETRDLIPLVHHLDRDLVNPANSDVRGPSSSRPLQWVENHIYFPLAEGGAVHLYRVDLRGRVEALITGERVVEDYSVHRSGRIILTLMDPTTPPELYVYERDRLTKVSAFNSFLLSRRKVSKPEKFSVRASDGEVLEGWILRPVDFKEGERYPAILAIHGGPMTSYGYGFIHEFHVLASKGFVVIYTNPRGSSGYTEKFKDIRGIYGDRDYLDLMEALDFALEKYDFIDQDRLGVMGGSYGGFMTNWIITRTDRFKAAVTQRSISNWISFYGTTDIGYHFGPDQIGGSFDRHFWVDDETYERYWEKSPIKHVKNVKTPLLIIHSEQDYRCWLDQALQMFTALKVKGVETRLVIFPKENHDLSRSGKPKHRVKRLEEIVGWFEKHLKG